MEHIGIIEKQWLKATKPTRIAGLLLNAMLEGGWQQGHFFQTNKKKKQRPREREREREKKEEGGEKFFLKFLT